MTPALLPGYRAISSCETGQGRLIKSDNSTDYVQGILIFGEGKVGRGRIREHYRPHSRRTKVSVETDVKTSRPPSDRRFLEERWQLQRRRFKAHAFLQRSGGCSKHPSICPETRPWTLEKYLENSEEDEQSLRIDPSVYGIEEDGGVSLLGSLTEDDVPDREIVWSGAGHLLYDRLEEGWSGW